MPTVDVYITPDSQVRAIYSKEAAEILGSLGECQVPRVSDVEQRADGCWWVDLSRIGGPEIGPFPLNAREEAIAAEIAWIHEHYLPNSRKD